MDYSNVISRAWQIIWKHKVLWIFGILSGCASGGGGGSNFRYSERRNLPLSTQNILENVPKSTVIAIVAAVIVVILILTVIFIFLGTIGRIGGIKGTLKADQDFDTSIRFGELFRQSMPYFWRVFLLSLMVGLIFFFVFLVGAIIAIFLAAITFGLFLVIFIPLFCLLIPIIIIVGVIVEQATIAIVTEDLGIINGLKRGWEVIITNPGPIAVMWAIFGLGVRGIGNLILSLPMIAAMIPLFIMLARGMNFAQSQLWVITLVCFVAYLPFLILLGGILSSFAQAGWTLTFERLTKPKNDTPEALEAPLPLPAE